MFDQPPPTQYNVLNLGAGVQSSALALMAAHGEITPTPDFAVFADVGAEPTEVYEWLETLKKLINAAPNPFPVYIVKHGNLTADSLKITTVSRGPNKGQPKVRRFIPAFGLLPDGSKTAAIGRSCTADYKIKPIEKFLKERFNIKRGQKDLVVTQYIGISWDELQRAKDNFPAWSQPRWPLLERRMKRQECHDWMASMGYPEPPRSACYYCPFHSDKEWRRMREHDPKHFAKAIKFDAKLRQMHKDHNKTLRMEVYLHSSCVPLSEIDFDNDEDKGQQTWDFQAECEGMCGV